MFCCLAPFCLSSTLLHTTHAWEIQTLSHRIHIYLLLVHTIPPYHHTTYPWFGQGCCSCIFSVAQHYTYLFQCIVFLFFSFSYFVFSVNNTTHDLFGLGLPLFHLLTLHHFVCICSIMYFMFVVIWQKWACTIQKRWLTAVTFPNSSANLLKQWRNQLRSLKS